MFMRRKIVKPKAVWIPKTPFYHAIVHLVDQIYEFLEYDNYTLRVFIYLSKAFDTVDNSILLKKLEMSGVNSTNLAWFASHLNGRKQYIKITECANIVKKNIKCEVQQAQCYNHFHNILRLFDVLPNFPFATSETMRNYYLQTWYIRVASRISKRLKN